MKKTSPYTFDLSRISTDLAYPQLCQDVDNYLAKLLTEMSIDAVELNPAAWKLLLDKARNNHKVRYGKGRPIKPNSLTRKLCHLIYLIHCATNIQPSEILQAIESDQPIENPIRQGTMSTGESVHCVLDIQAWHQEARICLPPAQTSDYKDFQKLKQILNGEMNAEFHLSGIDAAGSNLWITATTIPPLKNKDQEPNDNNPTKHFNIIAWLSEQSELLKSGNARKELETLLDRAFATAPQRWQQRTYNDCFKYNNEIHQIQTAEQAPIQKLYAEFSREMEKMPDNMVIEFHEV